MSTCCNNYERDSYNKKKNTDCRTILECGRGLFRTLPKSDFDALNPATGDSPVPLAEVIIDTRKLCKPCVKIEYSSLIKSVLTEGATAPSLTLTFRLVRKCKGEDEEDLSTWRYERTTDAATSLTSEDTFIVTFCECFDRACCDDAAGKCCTYTLQLVKVDVEGDITPTYTINEKDISAMATCPSCFC